MYSDQSRSRRQYTPLLGGNYDDNSSQASTEDGYQTGGLPFSLNAAPSDLKAAPIMSKGRSEIDDSLPRPITFADNKELLINKPEKSPAPSTTGFTDSFETSLKSVSDYSGFNDGPPDFSFVSTDATADAIQLCDSRVIKPYSFFLKIIGWLPLGQSRMARCFHVFLMIFWIVAILTAMVTQIITCFRRDISLVIGTEVDNKTMKLNATCEENLISTLILTDMVLLVNYFFGIFLFSKGETEYLFRLACHVFIKNAEAEHGGSSRKLITTIMVLLGAGVVWLFFSVFIRIITAISVELFNTDFVIFWEPNIRIEGVTKIVLVILSLFGFFTFDSVYLFSVLNYVAQAEMNVHLLRDIRQLLLSKKYDNVDGAMKDILEGQRYLKVLNGKTAALLALSLYLLCNLALSAIIDLDILNLKKFNAVSPAFYKLALSASVLNVFCWVALVCLPFVQAARVTYACEVLKDAGPEIRARPMQYRDTSQLDLDSLVTFISSLDIKSSIFGVPIYPWMMYAVLVAFSFTMLILFQQGVYSFTTYL